MGSTEFRGNLDPYIDPSTGILKNLVGADKQAELDKAEADLVFARALQLSDKDIPESRDLREVQLIHQHLFRDVYEWAGKLRTVDLRRPTGMALPFAPHRMLPIVAQNCFEALQNDSCLYEMSRTQFVHRLAYHYDALNYLHPFREGNGRTQRVFWGRIARATGREIEWFRISKTENDDACRIANEQQDLEPLIAIFDRAVPR